MPDATLTSVGSEFSRREVCEKGSGFSVNQVGDKKGTIKKTKRRRVARTNERARQRAHTVHNMETKLLGVVLQGMPVEHMAPILPRHMRGSTTSGQRRLDIAAIPSTIPIDGCPDW